MNSNADLDFKILQGMCYVRFRAPKLYYVRFLAGFIDMAPRPGLSNRGPRFKISAKRLPEYRSNTRPTHSLQLLHNKFSTWDWMPGFRNTIAMVEC